MNFQQNYPMSNPFAPQMPQQTDPFAPYGGIQAFQARLNNFANNLGQINPHQRVQQMLNSGEMTQQQFEQVRQKANAIMRVLNGRTF